jgi:CPA2 family monovalent cation:H+ antiporter-2
MGLVLLGAASAGWVARRVGLPAVLGYLAVGLVVSPFTPGFVADRESIELLAEFGVVLLLFEVGIEIDVNRLRREQRRLLVAAPVQMLVTTAVGTGVFVLAGLTTTTAAVLGLAVALSSSVVTVNIVRSRRRTTDRATESSMLGWNVLQDVVAVLMAAVLLAFAGVTDRSPLWAIAGLAGFIVVALLAAAGLPVVLRRLESEPDLFLIGSIAVGLALAGLGAAVFGVPVALAAFIAGLAVSESPETTAVRHRLLPFRDVFAVLFFVAVGTLIDPSLVGDGLEWIGLFILTLVVGKVAVMAVLARWAKVSRPGQLAVGLAQVGELSFVLASLLVGAELLADEIYVALLTVVVLSIAVSAVLVRIGWQRPSASLEPAQV